MRDREQVGGLLFLLYADGRARGGYPVRFRLHAAVDALRGLSAEELGVLACCAVVFLVVGVSEAVDWARS